MLFDAESAGVNPIHAAVRLLYISSMHLGSIHFGQRHVQCELAARTAGLR